MLQTKFRKSLKIKIPNKKKLDPQRTYTSSHLGQKFQVLYGWRQKYKLSNTKGKIPKSIWYFMRTSQSQKSLRTAISSNASLKRTNSSIFPCMYFFMYNSEFLEKLPSKLDPKYNGTEVTIFSRLKERPLT